MDYADVAVVIPALNEEESLPLVLAEMPEVGHIIVVDNGSTDGTAQVAEAEGAFVVHEARRGYGSACLAGIREAAHRQAAVLVILDADHSVDLQQLRLLVDPILQGEADFVLGDRTVHAERGALTFVQRFGNQLATSLIHRMTGHRYGDMGSFRAIDMDSLLAMQMEDPNYGWNVEMQMKAVYAGLRIREVAIRYRPRARGRSKISGTLRGTVKAGSKILLSTVRYMQ